MFSRRIFTPLVIALLFLGFLTVFNAKSFGEETDNPYVALIYNGKVAAEGGPEAVAEVMESMEIKVIYFDAPKELPSLLKEADICVIGGTEDEIEPLIEGFTPEVRKSLDKWLKDGGAYIGICGGAYIACEGWEEKHWTVKALDLVPLMSEAWIENENSRIITVKWDGKERSIYYQYGPFFIDNSSSDIKVLSRYDDGKIAILSHKFGKGIVVLSGPHPEADETWLDDDPVPLNSDDWEPTRDIFIEMIHIALSGIKKD